MHKSASPSYVEATLRTSPSSGQALSAPPSQGLCLPLRGSVIQITALLTVTIAGLRLHPEEPLVVLIGLMLLGIYFPLLTIGRACSRDDGGIDLINSASCSISHSRRYLVEDRLDPWPITACLQGLWLTDPPPSAPSRQSIISRAYCWH